MIPRLIGIMPPMGSLVRVAQLSWLKDGGGAVQRVASN